MGRRRKNPEHEKLPPKVYPNKYSYVWKPTSRESVTLTAIEDGLAALWKKYEETINHRDRAMTFGRLWEKFLASAGNDSNLLIVFYVQIMPDDFVMQLHRF